jgi:hypothetical protein
VAENEVADSPRLRSRAATVAIVLLILPFGWLLGVGLAIVWAGGSKIGQAPLLTIPISLLASVIFAMVPSVRRRTKLIVLVGGALLLYALVRGVLR